MNNTWDDKSDPIAGAAGWLTRITADEALTPAELEAFDRWFFASPENQEELARQFELHRLLYAAAPQLNAVWRPAAAHRKRQPSWSRVALAASILVAIGLTVWFARHPHESAASYSTQTGQTRTVRLADGSTVELNTRTRLEWTGQGTDRSVVLHEGEALFKVQPDPSHPFRVWVGETEIRVLGTAFDVYKKKRGEVAVTVLSGAVEVRARKRDDDTVDWRQIVRANERVVYQPSSLKHELTKIAAANVVRWREGVLEIDDEPLSEALEELGRYTDRRIRVADPRLSRLRVGVSVTTRDARAALARLQQMLPMTVSESQGGYTLNYREPKESSPSGIPSAQTELNTSNHN